VRRDGSRESGRPERRLNTFREPVARARRCFPDKTAVVDGDRRFTFAELADRLDRVGTALAALGASPGDRIAVLAENSHQYIEIYLGAPAVGMVFAPLNSRLSLAELEAICADCTPTLLFTDRHPEQLGSIPTLVGQVCSLGPEFESLLDSTVPSPLDHRPEEDATAVLLYTGGTTGRGKGVMLSHRNKLADALSVITSVGLVERDRWLVFSPMFHSSGTFSLLPSIWVGATTVVQPRFDPEAVLQAVAAEQITITFGVPTMLVSLVGLLRDKRVDTSSLRLLGHGAAPITPTQLGSVCEMLPDTEIMGMYGATEMAPMATTFSHQELQVGTERFGSCGRPVLGVELAVFDDAGREVPTGAVGEICVRGPNVMRGYWNLPIETAEALAGGWYHSGDLGRQDDDGFVYLVDRKKDMIISGGENVYSTEVENVLASAEGVFEVAVVGVPDDHWGEIVCGVVVSDTDVDAEALRAHCRRTLAGYKVPKRIVVRTEPLPRTPAGKVLKRDLRAELASTS
jgi:long-chain acyl-CoA synthetase